MTTEKQQEISPAAKRALAEAKSRREALEEQTKLPTAKEINGRNGPDPVRFGDWEKKGIAVDF